eukprot:4508020-Amphidinium_carterae.1
MPTLRQRNFWISWPFSPAPFEVHSNDHSSRVCVPADASRLWPLDEVWCSPHASRQHPDCPLPTIVRPIQRVKRPMQVWGWDDSSDAARTRWEADSYRYPLYQYETSCLLSSPDGLRPPDLHEREVLLGLPVDYTLCHFQHRGNAAKVIDDMHVRGTLLSGSFSVPVLLWLFSQLLAKCGALQQTLSAEDISSLLGRFTGDVKADLPLLLVRHVLIHQGHRPGRVARMHVSQRGAVTIPAQ